MAHWVQDFGIDGFRCDFASGVPTSFWNELTSRLRRLRPDLFFLAEAELPQHQLRAFNASYGFDMAQALDDVAQGRAGVSRIDDTLAAIRVNFPDRPTLMYYTSNHDRNSWEGTEFERLGGGTSAFAVLTFVLDGIPLIYNGQEIGLNRRLAFFERDPIVWHGDPRTDFYRALCGLKRSDPALRLGAQMRRIPTTRNDSIYAALRESDGHRVVAFLNLTARDVTAGAFDPSLNGRWRDVFTGKTVNLTAAVPLDLHAWQYWLLASRN
jgi:glycosidase